VFLIWITEILADEERGGDMVKEDMHTVATFPVIASCGVGGETRRVKG